jgi:hypothetical protein
MTKDANVKVLLEIFMIKEVDKWINNHKEVWSLTLEMLSLFLPRLMGNLAINKQNPMSLA